MQPIPPKPTSLAQKPRPTMTIKTCSTSSAHRRPLREAAQEGEVVLVEAARAQQPRRPPADRQQPVQRLEDRGAAAASAGERRIVRPGMPSR